jgi:hypothetical protein
MLREWPAEALLRREQYSPRRITVLEKVARICWQEVSGNNQIIRTYLDGGGQSGPFYYEQTNHHSIVKSIYTGLYKDSLVPQPTGPYPQPPPFLYPS